MRPRIRILAIPLLALLLMMLLPTAVQAAPVSYIDYDITTDTVWPAGDYYICCVGNREPQVTNGAHLRIESGARVYFSKRTSVQLPYTEHDPKYPYSTMTVINGSLSADGVTFTTVPDTPATGTAWRDAGWAKIVAFGAGTEGASNLSFSNCIFEHARETYGTVEGMEANGKNSEVNIYVSGCTFREPQCDVAAICYYNGFNTVGTGSLTVLNSTFTGYDRGVQMLRNGDDAVNITVSGCTFSGISTRPVEIAGGRNATVTGNTFNDFVVGQHEFPVLIFDAYSLTTDDQTVLFTDNCFNYGSEANIYPVVIGAGCRINENTSNPNNRFGADYPAAFRYIVLVADVGYGVYSAYRNAVWGEAGIPYLLTNSCTITAADQEQKSSLTIKPGVTVCLGDGSGADDLYVRGTLTAIGTAEKPITFTKKADVDCGNQITITHYLRGSVTLKHCIMDGLYRGIGIISPSTSAGQILLENCTIRNTQECAALNGCDLALKNCTFTGKGVSIDSGNQARAIRMEGCSLTASGSGSGTGIVISSTKAVTIKNCLISGFPGYGLFVSANKYATVAEGAPLLENCTVSRNGHGVVFAYSASSTTYGAYIINSILHGNLGLDLANRAGWTYFDTLCASKIPEGSIAYSLIGNDGSSLAFDGQGYHNHPSLGQIRQVVPASYANRVAGDPLFADAENGDYHLKSAEGRYSGGSWVTDTVTSNCINAGDPASSYANEPAPNGGRINIGCYGNTAEASKSGRPSLSYTISHPDGKVDGYDAYSVAACSGFSSPVSANGSYSFTVSIGNAFYQTDAFRVKANNMELTPDVDTGVYTISNITANQLITVEGVAIISAPVITQQPQDCTITEGENAVFSVAATGFNLSYLWQRSTDEGNSWHGLYGGNSSSFELEAPGLEHNGHMYRCSITSSALSGIPRYNALSHVVTLTVTAEPEVPPLEIAVFRTGWADSYEPGQTVNLAARGEGGTAPYKYQFYVLRSNGSRVNFRKDPVFSNIYPWTPVTPDTYTLGVDVHDAAGQKVSQEKTITVREAEVPPLIIAVFRTGWADSYEPGQTINLAARAEGGIAPYKYQFYVVRSNGVRGNFRKDPVSANIYPWTPVTPGTYTIGVDVYDARGQKVSQEKTITVREPEAPPLEIAVFRAGWSDSYEAGQTVNLAARGEGGAAPYKYQFYVVRSNGSRVNFRKNPVSSNIYPWTPVTPDTYTLGVDVYDARGQKVSQEKTITVTAKP
ncbi:MAG: right-handed parallel beta-helix repeat-containing protein [Bacillota bacterium]|nr:right-handed parallel beta-helix repeat-containing protein [Bacillota bacterium]